jgi:hypothetical protein
VIHVLLALIRCWREKQIAIYAPKVHTSHNQEPLNAYFVLWEQLPTLTVHQIAHRVLLVLKPTQLDCDHARYVKLVDLLHLTIKSRA